MIIIRNAFASSIPVLDTSTDISGDVTTGTPIGTPHYGTPSFSEMIDGTSNTTDINHGMVGNYSQSTAAVSNGFGVKVDFGASGDRALGKWRVWMHLNRHINGFDVDYSDNDSSWTTVADLTTGGNGGNWDEITWDYADAHRYWRIIANANASSGVNGPGITEIELFEYV